MELATAISKNKTTVPATVEALLDKPKSMLHDFHENAFQLGLILDEIKSTRAYKARHKHFTDYIEHELGLSVRTVQRVMLVARFITVYRIPTSTPHDRIISIKPYLDSIGEARIKEVLMLPAPEFKAEIEKYKKDNLSPSEFIEVRFHVTEEQKGIIEQALKKCKEQGQTESDGQALEYIMADFLAGMQNEQG